MTVFKSLIIYPESRLVGGRSMAEAYRFQRVSSSCLGYEVYSGDVATLLTTVEAEVAEKKWEVMMVEIKLFNLKF